MEERKEIDIPAIFEKIKELDNEKKMQLKRAANVSFENLQTTQRITFFNLLDDDSMGKAKSEFLRFQAGILGYSIAGMKAFEGKFSYENQLFS